MPLHAFTAHKIECDHCKQPLDNGDYEPWFLNPEDAKEAWSDSEGWTDGETWVCFDDLMEPHEFVADKAGNDHCDRCGMPPEEHGEEAP